MKSKITEIIISLIAVVILAVAGFVVWKSSISNNISVGGKTNASSTKPSAQPQYKNDQYGFSVLLPQSWAGYTIIEDKWLGYTTGEQGDQKFTEGPLLSIRHPLWTPVVPRQDIPVIVFTTSQWQDLLIDKFHIGAAPIGPSKLDNNTDFVFALPARYNYAFPVGYEEVDQIINNTENFKAF